MICIKDIIKESPNIASVLYFVVFITIAISMISIFVAWQVPSSMQFYRIMLLCVVYAIYFNIKYKDTYK